MEEDTKKEEEIKEEEPQQDVAEPAPEAVEEKPLDKMTAPELKEIALNIPGATGVTAMKKDQLLALIKEHRGIEDEEPLKKKKAVLISIKDKVTPKNFEGSRKKLSSLLKKRFDTYIFKSIPQDIFTAHTIKLLLSFEKSVGSKSGLVMDQDSEDLIRFSGLGNKFITGKNEKTVLMEVEVQKNY